MKAQKISLLHQLNIEQTFYFSRVATFTFMNFQIRKQFCFYVKAGCLIDSNSIQKFSFLYENYASDATFIILKLGRKHIPAGYFGTDK